MKIRGICLLFICLLCSCKESSITIITIDDVHFPDAIFREAICSYLGKTEGDTLHLSTLERIDELDLSTLGISSIKGIEYFTNLRTLDCGENLLTEVDLSRNAALGKLELYRNRLTRLDVSGNPGLYALSCSFNRLTALDVSGNPDLLVLLCNGNPLDSISLAGNPRLEELGVNDCRLSSLDISGNPELKSLYCMRNRFPELDLRGNPKLRDLVLVQPSLGNIRVLLPESIGADKTKLSRIWSDRLVEWWFNNEMEERHKALVLEKAFTTVEETFPMDTLAFNTLLGEMDAFIENMKGVRIRTLADTVRLSPLVERMDKWKDYPEILYWPSHDRDSLTSAQEERLRSTVMGIGSEMVRIYSEMKRAGYKSDDSEFLLGMLNLRESI